MAHDSDRHWPWLASRLRNRGQAAGAVRLRSACNKARSAYPFYLTQALLRVSDSETLGRITLTRSLRIAVRPAQAEPEWGQGFGSHELELPM